MHRGESLFSAKGKSRPADSRQPTLALALSLGRDINGKGKGAADGADVKGSILFSQTRIHPFPNTSLSRTCDDLTPFPVETPVDKVASKPPPSFCSSCSLCSYVSE